jgi:branched-chain amino acid transport system ATP-binding protein
MKTLLVAKNLSKNFLGIVAVSNASIRVDEGEIVSIIGPNGAGKTTLLNLLSGVIRPSSGSVEFEGQVVTHLGPHQYAGLGITRTFQNLALFKVGTVLDNIRIGFHSRIQSGVLASAFFLPHVKREEAMLLDKAREIASFLEIENLLHVIVGTLSYGQQKRVELARALAAGPKLLLLDELISGMNLEEKQSIARFIFQIQRRYGCGIAMIEHDLGFVMDISDRIYVLNFGHQIAEGSPSEIASNPEVIAAYVGSSMQKENTERRDLAV